MNNIKDDNMFNECDINDSMRVMKRKIIAITKPSLDLIDKFE